MERRLLLDECDDDDGERGKFWRGGGGAEAEAEATAVEDEKARMRRVEGLGIGARRAAGVSSRGGILCMVCGGC